MEDLETRLSAVERALADGEADPTFAEAAAVDDRLDDVETAVADLRDRVDDLAGDLQAVQGCLGDREIEEATERRVEAALARLETLERRLDGQSGGVPAEDEIADAADPQHAADAPGESTGRPGPERWSSTGDDGAGEEWQPVDGRPVNGSAAEEATSDGGNPRARRRDGRHPPRARTGPAGRREAPGTDDRSARAATGAPARSDGTGDDRGTRDVDAGTCVRCGRRPLENESTGSRDRSRRGPVDGEGVPHPAVDEESEGLLDRLRGLV